MRLANQRASKGNVDSMSFLVTGAAGFIGYEVCRQLIDAGEEVVGLDSLSSALYPDSEKRMRWNSLSGEASVTLLKANLAEGVPAKALGVKTIIHLAATPGLRPSWTQFGDYVESNLIAAEKLASWSIDNGVEKFINISTSSVYGSTATSSEDGPKQPSSPYGVTKLAAEHLLDAFSSSHGLQVAHLRYFSVYGPGQRPDMAYRRFINALLTRSEIQLYGDGSQSRTNTFVRDIARWTIRAAKSDTAIGAYNLSGKEPVTMVEAIALLEEITGERARIVNSAAVPGDQKLTQGDITKATKAGIIDFHTNLGEGLTAQVEWQRHMLGGLRFKDKGK